VDPLSLAQAGPVAIVLVGIALLYRAFIKGDIVVGSLYRDQVVRADKSEARAVKAELRADRAETQAQRNTESLVAVADTVKTGLENRGMGGSSDVG
jgi:hypothetical protein